MGGWDLLLEVKKQLGRDALFLHGDTLDRIQELLLYAVCSERPVKIVHSTSIGHEPELTHIVEQVLDHTLSPREH